MTKSVLVQGNLMSTSSYQTALYNLNWICVIITKLKSSKMWLSQYTDNFLFLAKKKLDLQTYTFGFWFCVLVWYTFYHSPNPPQTQQHRFHFIFPKLCCFQFFPDAHLDISLAAVLPEVPAWSKWTETESVTPPFVIRPTDFDGPFLLCQTHAKSCNKPLKNT